MKIVLSHPTGNANVRAILSGLAKDDNLVAFYTSIAIFPNTLTSRLVDNSHLPFSDFTRRRFDAILKPYTRSFPWRELGRLMLSKLNIKSLVAHEKGYFSVDNVYHNLDRKVASSIVSINALDAVYAYEDGALNTFESAKKLGIKCIYDLPIAYWETLRRLLNEERERLPEWASTLKGGVLDSTQKLERKSKELALADVIVTPSQFVVDSLPAWVNRDKVILSQFGSPVVSFTPPEIKNYGKNPLRVLFVGSMGQRKGLGDLFQAIKILDTSEVELVVMGGLLEDISFYRNKFPNFVYEAPRSHHEVLALMRTCDVFCLPSIVEGRALVIQEAMSQGLPLIITPNTGGEDLVKEGETGFVVPIRNPEMIANRIQWFLENRDCINEMRRNAQEHAMLYTWENYSKRVVNLIKQLIVK